MSSYDGPSLLKPLMNSDSATESGHQIRRVVRLEKQTEIRIKVHETSPLKLRVLDGKVEIFGSELPPNIWLTFQPLQQFAVFTWYGATLEIDGVKENEYTSQSNETPMLSNLDLHNSLQMQRHCLTSSARYSVSSQTPMISYLDLHNSLQVQRHRVTSSARYSVSSQGPIVIIVGDIDSGKSALAKMLLSWAAKDGCKPTFVDLNVGQSLITIPGTISASSVEMPLDPVEGFPTSKAIVHYFGHTTPSNNLKLYKALVEELAGELEEEFAKNAESRCSGMVIDTMGWTHGVGFELLRHAIRKFNASLVVVLGQEETLVNELNKAFKYKNNLQILNLEKSDGVFSRSSTFRKKWRNNSIQKYFHGATNDLTAYTKTVKFSDVQVYQIGDLPGSSRYGQPLKITPVTIDKDLVNKVLAISYAKQPDQIISSIVAGFVSIKDVNILEQKITYLSPSVAELPNNILIMGTLTCQESNEREE